MKRLLFGIVLLIAASCAFAQQDIQGVAFSSAARTALSYNTIDFTNLTARGVVVVINTTVFTAGTYTYTIQGKDPASGNYYTILASAAIAATGTVVLRVYPGLTAAANTVASDVLPKTWRILITGATSPNQTASVGFSTIQ